jgi:hypothetical protein
MSISFRAFADELVLIKRAEVEASEEEKPKLDNKELFKQLAVNSLVYGTGLGLGTGLGYVGAEKLLPKAFPKMPGWQRWGVSGLAGALTALGGLGAWEAYRLARKREDDLAAERDDKVIQD